MPKYNNFIIHNNDKKMQRLFYYTIIRVLWGSETKVFVSCISHAKHIFNTNNRIYPADIFPVHLVIIIFFSALFHFSEMYNGRRSKLDIKSYTVTGCMTEIFSVTVFETGLFTIYRHQNILLRVLRWLRLQQKLSF